MDELAQFQQTFLEHDLVCSYQSDVYRFVETQEYAATTNLVDDLDEQFLLEQMLDDVKPTYRPGTEHMHYLLKTPFRYPPLEYGSRFGTRLMPSFFYAGESVETTLSEVAYYRFVFLSHMSVPYEQAIRSEHLLFSIHVDTQACANLTHPTLDTFSSSLRQTNGYGFCQKVGKWLIEERQVAMIRYYSARQNDGKNVAIYQPSAISSSQPDTQQRWLCLTKPGSISFSQHGQKEKPLSYDLEQYLVGGQLPLPA